MSTADWIEQPLSRANSVMVSRTVCCPDHRTCSGIKPTIERNASLLRISPSLEISPSLSGKTPLMIRSRVVFPAPLVPTKPTIFPFKTVKSICEIPGPCPLLKWIVPLWIRYLVTKTNGRELYCNLSAHDTAWRSPISNALFLLSVSQMHMMDNE